jgi:hypothetical protein
MSMPMNRKSVPQKADERKKLEAKRKLVEGQWRLT